MSRFFKTATTSGRWDGGMSTEAKARFTVESWTETVRSDIDGTTTTINGVDYPERGLSRADVTYRYTGDLEGTSVLTYLIAYRPGGGPTLGFERFEGTLHGRSGSFVLQHVGEQDEQGVRSRTTVVEAMGTGELAGLTGEAKLAIEGHSDEGYELVLRYDG